MKPSDIRPRAILFGFLTDLIGSTITGIVLGIGIFFYAAFTHSGTPEHLAALLQNNALRIVGLIGTTLSTALGGYIAARLGIPFGRQHAVIVGCISLVLGIALAVLNPGITPTWKLISGLILTIPASWLGGTID